MSEWKDFELKELTTKIGSGATPRGGQEAYKAEGISLIRSQNILDFSFSYSGLAFIDDEQAHDLRNVIIEKDDVLINITGDSVARVAKVPDNVLPARVNQHVAILRADKDKLDSDYLLYYLLNPVFKRHLLRIASDGATRNALTKADLEELIIVAPEDVNIQKEIARLLSIYDQKITLLCQQNQDLEELAQTLFKRWFVEFEFPNENGEPYKSSGGKMVESELGEIPEGWRVVQLKELANKISKGTTPRQNEIAGLGSDVPFIKVKDITDDGQIKFGDIENIPSSVHNASLKRSILFQNDILFSIAGTIGRVTIVPSKLNNSNCNQAVAFIRLNDLRYLELIHQWFKSNNIQNEINASIVQGVQANVSLGVLGNLVLNLPNPNFIEKWKAVIKPIYDKRNNCSNEIQTLTQIRDTLLPKLMIGELKINC